MTPLVTFKGWEGKWWKNIKPGRAAASALVTVLPGSGAVGTIGKAVGQRVGSKLIRGASRTIGRWFRGAKGKRVGVHPGIRTARGGSAVTSGKLDLGGGKSFRAGSAFNIGGWRAAATAAKVGAGGAAAVGVSRLVRPSAAVTAANGMSSAQLSPRTSSAPRSSSPTRASSGTGTRCCPPGQRHLCFKRKRNPEAEAKRRARRKAAREKTKERVARARGSRRSGAPSAKQRAARARFAKAAKRGPIRKGARL